MNNTNKPDEHLSRHPVWQEKWIERQLFANKAESFYDIEKAREAFEELQKKKRITISGIIKYRQKHLNQLGKHRIRNAIAARALRASGSQASNQIAISKKSMEQLTQIRGWLPDIYKSNQSVLAEALNQLHEKIKKESGNE